MFFPSTKKITTKGTTSPRLRSSFAGSFLAHFSTPNINGQERWSSRRRAADGPRWCNNPQIPFGIRFKAPQNLYSLLEGFLVANDLVFRWPKSLSLLFIHGFGGLNVHYIADMNHCMVEYHLSQTS